MRCRVSRVHKPRVPACVSVCVCTFGGASNFCGALVPKGSGRSRRLIVGLCVCVLDWQTVTSVSQTHMQTVAAFNRAPKHTHTNKRIQNARARATVIRWVIEMLHAIVILGRHRRHSHRRRRSRRRCAASTPLASTNISKLRNRTLHTTDARIHTHTHTLTHMALIHTAHVFREHTNPSV